MTRLDNILQTTVTQDHLQQDWVCHGKKPLSIKRLRHYRLVLAVAGYSFQDFSDTRDDEFATICF